jgi:hypothetical protein
MMVDMTNIPPPGPERKRITRKRIIIGTCVVAFVLVANALYSSWQNRWSISPYQAEVLTDVFNDYDISQRFALCGNIDRPDEEGALALFGLHYVQEVERRGDDLVEAGFPEPEAFKDAAMQMCSDIFGGADWWENRATRPDGPIPIEDLVAD